MMTDPILRTERLVLRPWRQEDLAPFAALNGDARVMVYFQAPLTEAQTSDVMARVMSDFERDGWGLFAVEVPGLWPFAGFVGLARPHFEARFTPCVEIGWRLTYEAQGRGFATEAARRVVRFAFEQLRLPELVSFTVPRNLPSRRVMEKLGMQLDGEFDHPAIPEGHPLRRHVLYRLRRSSTHG